MRAALISLFLLSILVAVFLSTGGRRMSSDAGSVLPPERNMRTTEVPLVAPLAEFAAPREIVPVVGTSTPAGIPAPASAVEVGPHVVLRIVSEATGLPIEGVNVSGDTGRPFGDMSMDGHSDLLTDAEGVVRFPLEVGTEPDERWVKLAATGYVERNFTLPPYQWEVVAPLAPGIRYEVYVTNGQTGEPFAGVPVLATQWSEGEPWRSSKARMTTGASGVVRMPEVHPELPLHVTVAAKGYVPVKETLQIETFGRHEVRLGAGGSVHVRVLAANGDPIPSATLGFRAHNGAYLGGMGVFSSDDSGNSWLAGLPLDQEFTLLSTKPFLRAEPFVLTRAEPERWIELRAERAPCALNVTVRNERGEPWPQAWGALRRRNSPEGERWPSSVAGRVVAQGGANNEDGRIALKVPESGNFVMEVSNGSGSLETVMVSLVPGEVVEVDVVIQSGAALRGRVVDHDGAPLRGLAVWFERNRSSTDDAGYFEFTGLPNEPGMLTVTKDVMPDIGGAQILTWMRFEGVMPGKELIELKRPEPVWIQGQVIDLATVRRVEWAVSFDGREQLFVETQPMQDGTAGIFVAVASDAWELAVRVKYYNGTQSMDVYTDLDRRPGSTTNLGQLGAAPTRAIRGTVRTADGAVAVGADVDLKLAGFQFGKQTTTDERGLFVFEGVPAVNGGLYASKGNEDLYREAMFGADSRDETIDLTLTRGEYVRGDVHTADGAPLAGARVWVFRVEVQGEMETGSSTGTNAEGKFRNMTGPGTFQIFVETPDGSETILGPRVVVTAGSDQEVVIQLP